MFYNHNRCNPTSLRVLPRDTYNTTELPPVTSLVISSMLIVMIEQVEVNANRDVSYTLENISTQSQCHATPTHPSPLFSPMSKSISRQSIYSNDRRILTRDDAGNNVSYKLTSNAKLVYKRIRRCNYLYSSFIGRRDVFCVRYLVMLTPLP